jgi:hypothetical protein
LRDGALELCPVMTHDVDAVAALLEAPEGAAMLARMPDFVTRQRLAVDMAGAWRAGHGAFWITATDTATLGLIGAISSLDDPGLMLVDGFSVPAKRRPKHAGARALRLVATWVTEMGWRPRLDIPCGDESAIAAAERAEIPWTPGPERVDLARMIWEALDMPSPPGGYDL